MSSAVAERNELPWPWWLVLIQGIALTILGILFFTSPAATWASMVWVLGLYWIFSGIMNLFGMFQDHSKWGWTLAFFSFATNYTNFTKKWTKNSSNSCNSWRKM